jgi:hypothetical protein
MKLFSGWVIPAGLVLMAGAANAQMLAPYDAGRSPYAPVSDIDGPYAAMPPDEAPPRSGPMLLPAREVYTVVRESGFSPLGIPQKRGLFYTIAVIDRAGVDGWLVIDARDGRVVRRMPGDRMGGDGNGEPMQYGAAGPLPPISTVKGPPRPPASIPRVASRTPSVPIPKAAPPHAGDEPKVLAAKPVPEPSQPSPSVQPSAAPPAQPPQQSAAVQAKPAEVQSAPPAVASAPVEAKPSETKSSETKTGAAQIQPTQEMPKVQGLE